MSGITINAPEELFFLSLALPLLLYDFSDNILALLKEMFL